jgi:diguanylate cyclase (GGDEF)-like protein
MARAFHERAHCTGPDHFAIGVDGRAVIRFQRMSLATATQPNTAATGPTNNRPAITHSVSHPDADILVFERTEAGFSLIGGNGRGEGWAGIVDVAEAEQTLVRRAWSGGMLVRVNARRPQQIVGPYHARSAAAVPVGDRHVVVVGSNRRLDMSDSDVVRLAVSAVDRTHGVPADKLLADELELVQALRSLMAYQAENVRDTLQHIATVAARSLSCEIAVIRVQHSGGLVAEAFGLPSPVVRELETEPDARPPLDTSDEPRVDQVAPDAWQRLGTDLASSMSLPLGAPPIQGVLALGHARSHARGFTSLCQRIGRAIAESAELLIAQAVAREQLASERDLLARVSGTDPLTGVANRRAWDLEAEVIAAANRNECGYVIVCDLDGLKETNDAYGHAAGDALIRGAASLLQSCVRGTDLVARVGGDEFAVLLRGATASTANGVRQRIRRSEHQWRVTEFGLTPRLSLGVAEICAGDIAGALVTADARMYADKRRRTRLGPEFKRGANRV